MNKEITEYLSSISNIDKDKNIENKDSEKSEEVKPSEEFESFVTEEVNISNEENDIEIDNDEYETIEEARSGQKKEEPEIYSVTPETYEDFER